MYNNKYSAPTSPTLSARTSNSITHSVRTAEPFSNPSVILTRTDMRSSIEAYEQLLASAKVYRNQLIALAQATANFGQSLERIAHCKGAFENGPSFQAAAGLHYLTSNHQQLLSDALYKNFEIPLLENLDVHKSTIFASEENYDKALAEMSKKIKETEAENLRIGRKRQRDLTQFRNALQDLTRQVEDLDRLKTEYHRQSLENEQNNLKYILSKVSTVIKAEVDIFDRISSKGLADPLLEAMTTQSPDPFCTYQTADQFSEIFSILPPVPIINHTVDISSTTTSVLNGFSNDDIQTHKNNSRKEVIGDEDGDSDESQGIFKSVASSHYRQSQKIFSDTDSNNIGNNILNIKVVVEEAEETEAKESNDEFGSENVKIKQQYTKTTTTTTNPNKLLKTSSSSSSPSSSSSSLPLSSSPSPPSSLPNKNNDNNTTINSEQSSINSVISPFDQNFNKSNKNAMNIPDDILNNKEFKFEDDEDGVIKD